MSRADSAEVVQMVQGGVGENTSHDNLVAITHENRAVVTSARNVSGQNSAITRMQCEIYIIMHCFDNITDKIIQKQWTYNAALLYTHRNGFDSDINLNIYIITIML